MALRKKPPLIIALIATLLFVGGGALTIWLLSRRGGVAETLPAGSDVIPHDAVLTLTLTSDGNQWRRLRQFGTENTRPQLDQLLARWRNQLLINNGLNFETDLAPWVGPEVTLAVLPELNPASADDAPSPLPGPETVLEQNLLVVIPIADANRAQTNFGDRLTPAELEENPYRGVTVQQIETPDGDVLYGAVLNPSTAILSPKLELILRSIDTVKGGNALADVAGFTRAFDHIDKTSAFARLYLDVPSAVQTLSTLSDPPLPPQTLNALESPRGLGGVVTLSNQGIHFQGVSWLEPGSQIFPTGNPADQMPQRFPTNALMMVSGGDFQQFWEDFQTGQQLSALFPFSSQDLDNGLQTATGLSLDNDFLPWMEGEFGLGLLVPPEGAAAAPDANGSESPPLPNPALAVLVEASDLEAATATLDRLNTIMENRYRFAVDAVDLGGVAVTRWTSPFNSLSLSYGWLEGNVLFLTVGEGIADMLAPEPSKALDTNPLFQATTGAAPRPNNGHFFLNMAALAEAENSLLVPPLSEAGLVGTEAVEAIGVTATVLSDLQVQYDLEVALKRGSRPGPLPSPLAPGPTPNSETENSQETDVPDNTPSPEAPSE
jgi:hypothetical protein